MIEAFAEALKFQAKANPEMTLEAIGEELIRGYNESGYKYGPLKYFREGAYVKKPDVDDGMYERVAEAHEQKAARGRGKL